MSDRNVISSALDHKITPWLIAALAYFGTNAFEAMQNDGADVGNDIEQIKVDLAVVKNDVETLMNDLSDSAPNRWTRKQQDLHSKEMDRRFGEVERRLERLETRGR